MNLANLNLRTIGILIYIMVNVIVFSMYAVDKYKAKHNKWRISERTLIVAAAFGIFGAILGMRVMHHKTKKTKFLIAIPLIALAEVTGMVLYLIKIHPNLI